MFVVRFGGGLGNQLFQLSMLLTLSNHIGEEIKYDSSSYLYFNEHDGFDLPKYFSFQYKEIDLSILKKISPIKYWLAKNNIQISNLNIYSFVYKVDKVYSLILQRFIADFRIIRDDNIKSISDLQKLNPEKNYYFDGRWQDISLYDLNYIRNNISFKVLLSESDMLDLEEINSCNSVSIHIRRGDFTTNDGFNICGVKYYQEAVLRLLKIKDLRIEDVTFFFFGDDHNYIEQHYKFPNMKMVKGSNAGVDMFLMSKCRYNIIANSTFSFWAALLNKNQELTIAPKYSFANKERKNLFSVPSNWITLDNMGD